MTTRFALLPVIALAVAACSTDSTTATGPGPDRLPAPLFITNFEGNAPGGAHYAQGFAEPTCTEVDLVVSCTNTQIGGVGNTDATLTLDVNFSATVQCRNHGGKIVDVKSQATLAVVAPDDLTETRNGQLFVSAFSSDLAPTEEQFTAAATCPNGNWTKELLEGTPDITSFTYTLTFDGFDNPAIIVTGPTP